MSDREKIVKGLECCIEAEDEACPEECPFYKECLTDDRPFYPVIRAALKLLKEQKTVRNSISKKQMDAWLKNRRQEEWTNKVHEMGE